MRLSNRIYRPHFVDVSVLSAYQKFLPFSPAPILRQILDHDGSVMARCQDLNLDSLLYYNILDKAGF
jgi:hypothetical protein